MQIKDCNYFNSCRCRSCSLLQAGSPELPELPQELTAVLNPWQRVTEAFHSRAKAKMSVTGTIAKPVIGILDAELKGVELLQCPLHKLVINKALEQLPQIISENRLEPYSIKNKTGNLKGIILQTNLKEDHLRLRFVVKDSSQVDLYKKIKLKLNTKISTSLNIQAIAHQILEGPEEHHLVGEELIWEEYNQISVAFPAKSFMQVTPEVASKLYNQAAELIKKYKSSIVLDLFCGAGGFALSVAKNCKKVYGLEISKQAIEAAVISATKNKLENIEFSSVDLLEHVNEIKADTVICNPPRRGLGKKVIDYLLKLEPRLILYSSCDVNNFLKDYSELKKSYTLKEITPFEMFPLTKHFEVLAVLEKN